MSDRPYSGPALEVRGRREAPAIHPRVFGAGTPDRRGRFHRRAEVRFVDVAPSSADATPRATLTGRIARNELSTLAETVRDLESRGLLHVEEVRAGTAAARRAKQLRSSVHRGEAEALGWALADHVSALPVFISCDRRARQVAHNNGLLCGDVFDLALAWHGFGLADLPELESAFAEWDSGPPGKLWRPQDFRSVKEELARREDQRLHRHWRGLSSV